VLKEENNKWKEHGWAAIRKSDGTMDHAGIRSTEEGRGKQPGRGEANSRGRRSA
jgi:hypothetical protein